MATKTTKIVTVGEGDFVLCINVFVYIRVCFHAVSQLTTGSREGCSVRSQTVGGDRKSVV